MDVDGCDSETRSVLDDSRRAVGGGSRVVKKFRADRSDHTVGEFHVYIEGYGEPELICVVQTIREAWDIVWQDCLKTWQRMRRDSHYSQDDYPHPRDFVRASARGTRESRAVLHSVLYDMPAPETVLRGVATYIVDVPDAVYYVCRGDWEEWCGLWEPAAPATKRKLDDFGAQ